MTWILSLMMGNPLGRTMAKYAAIGALVVMAAYMIYRKGRNDKALSQAIATTKMLKEKIDVDQEIRRMSLDDRRTELKRWLR